MRSTSPSHEQTMVEELRALRAEVAALGAAAEATAAATRSTARVLQSLLPDSSALPLIVSGEPTPPDTAQASPDSRPAD